MSSSPQISGYQFDHQLLAHPLAELWRGRSFTGMEVVALVLSEAAARDEVVRDRLVRAGRGAALEPGQQETPLWAANFTAERPYAITQLVPGQTGAERLIDPLDGILGNDQDALQAVRAQLSQYGAKPPEVSELPSYAESQPTTEPTPPTAEQQRSKVALAREYRHKIGGWFYVVATLGVLVVFSVTYSIGSAIGSTVKDEPVEAIPAAVSPQPFPSPALLPGVERITTAKYKEPDGAPGVVGATYPAGTDVQSVVDAGFPFPFGWPQPPEVTSLGESSTAVYLQVVTRTSEHRPRATLQARIALHQCDDLAACLADRATVDAGWTKAFNAPAPSTAKDARTWFAEQRSEQKTKAYTLTMSHVFLSGGRWWLVGVAAKGATGEDKAVQQIVNDIWRQTG